MNVNNKNYMFIVNNLGIGGSERKTVRIVNRLVQMGHRVHLAYLNVSGSEGLLNQIDTRIMLLNLRREGKFDWRVIKRLKNYITEYDIRLVWCINLYPMIYSYLAVRGMRKYVKLYVSTNTTHFPNMFERIAMILYVPLLHTMDRIIFGSNYQQKRWSGTYCLNKKKVTTIHNGVDLNKFSPALYSDKRDYLRESMGFSGQDIVLGMVAQFRPEKAHADLLHALKQLYEHGKPVKLLLVGDGPTRTEIEQLADFLGLKERVLFAGLISDVRPHLVAMDVFILTSVAVETFSNAALEAMAMGTPVILSNLSGAPEMVEDGVTGLLFDPGDVEGIVTSVESLLDPAVRKKFSSKAKIRVQEEFSFSHMIKDYERALAMLDQFG